MVLNLHKMLIVNQPQEVKLNFSEEDIPPGASDLDSCPGMAHPHWDAFSESQPVNSWMFNTSSNPSWSNLNSLTHQSEPQAGLTIV